MIEMAQYHNIKFLKEVEGLSERQIATNLVNLFSSFFFCLFAFLDIECVSLVLDSGLLLLVHENPSYSVRLRKGCSN